MKRALPDVNVLLVLTWPDHQHHAAAQAWFRREGRQGWAPCDLTQLSFVRLSSNPTFTPASARPPAVAPRASAQAGRRATRARRLPERKSATSVRGRVGRWTARAPHTPSREPTGRRLRRATAVSGFAASRPRRAPEHLLRGALLVSQAPTSLPVRRARLRTRLRSARQATSVQRMGLVPGGVATHVIPRTVSHALS